MVCYSFSFYSTVKLMLNTVIRNRFILALDRARDTGRMNITLQVENGKPKADDEPREAQQLV